MAESAFAGDPSISLGIKPLGSSAAPLPDPLSTAQKLIGIQNSLNQQKLFNQTFSARQKAGQILAGAPDLETGLKSLYADPLTAPFAPEIVSSVRQGMLAQTQQMGEIQKQGLEGFGGFMKALPGAIANPASFDKLAAAYKANLSPQVHKQYDTAVANVRQSLIDGLPEDPLAAQTELRKRFAGLATSAGMSPEVFGVAAGKPGVQDTGGALVPTMQNAATGELTPAGTPLGKSLAPTLSSGPYGEGGAQVPFVAGGGNALAPRGGATPLALSGPTQQQQHYNEASGKEAADLQSEMSKRAEALPTSLKRIDIMNDAITKFQAGGGADARAALGKIMQAAKNAGADFITQEGIDAVANGSLEGTQVFNAQVKPMVIGALKEAAQGTGRVMRSEVDAFMNMMNSTSDPNAIMTLLNQARFALQVGYDQSQKFTQFKQLLRKKDPSVEGLDMGDFHSWYNKNYSEFGLPGGNAGGMGLDARSSAGVKGAARALDDILGIKPK